MTARLWSLDTMTNVVAYRGHAKPIWDVDWSPRGIYFATGSRDHTARLWSTDRIQPLRIFAGHLNDVDVSLFWSAFYWAGYSQLLPFPVACKIPPQLALPCHWFDRHHLPSLGRPTRCLCACLPWTSRTCHGNCDFSRWKVPRLRGRGPRNQSLGPRLRSPDQEDDGTHCHGVLPRFFPGE